MQAKKYPSHYYIILFLGIVLIIIFWSIIINNFNNYYSGFPKSETEYWDQDYLPEDEAQIIPVDTNRIIVDSINQRQIVSNIVNIAIKNSSISIAKFANEFKNIYTSDIYQIIYIDSVINRIQIKLPESERISFKKDVKLKLNKYKLLVWDETIFSSTKTFNDPKLNDNNYNWYFEEIQIANAWKETTGNKKIVIAVIDNGFDLNHPELLNKGVKPYNVIYKNHDVSPSPENHGTHVASIIVANANNNQGMVGICPDCLFMPIKVEDNNGIMTNTYIIDAILYAIKNKADIINLSLGMQIPDSISISLKDQKNYINSSAKDEEEFWIDLFNYANEKNIVCVLAAGNSNILTGIDPFTRAKSTIKVGATNKSNGIASFSNYGDLTTIFAPGVDIYGAKPNNRYESLQGTSMAAPIVSGIVGLIKSKYNNISNQEINNILDRNSKIINNIKVLNVKNPLK